jgi:hypothetical protein
MIEWTIIISVSIGLTFLFVIFFGAPFLPIQHDRAAEAMDMLNLKPGQLLLDLGSGDGRMLKLAAERGIRCIGYELNPILAGYSWLRTWRYRHLVSVKCASYWRGVLPQCDAMYIFLLQPYMARLDHKLTHELITPTPVLSFVYTFPGRKPHKQQKGLHLYMFEPET